jgi:hypothetical protein
VVSVSVAGTGTIVTVIREMGYFYQGLKIILLTYNFRTKSEMCKWSSEHNHHVFVETAHVSVLPFELQYHVFVVILTFLHGILLLTFLFSSVYSVDKENYTNYYWKIILQLFVVSVSVAGTGTIVTVIREMGYFYQGLKIILLSLRIATNTVTEIVLKVALNTINLDVKQLHDHPGANLRNKIITYI